MMALEDVLQEMVVPRFEIRDCQIGNARQFTSSEDKGFNPQSHLLPLHQELRTPEEA